MAVTEEARHGLYTQLVETMGDERAATMMELLPPTGWGDIATKQDVEQLGVVTKQEIDTLRVTTKQEIDTLRVTTKQEIDTLRMLTQKEAERLEQSITAHVERVRSEFHKTLRSHTLVLVATNVALLGMATGVIAALVR